MTSSCTAGETKHLGLTSACLRPMASTCFVRRIFSSVLSGFFRKIRSIRSFLSCPISIVSDRHRIAGKCKAQSGCYRAAAKSLQFVVDDSAISPRPFCFRFCWGFPSTSSWRLSAIAKRAQSLTESNPNGR